MKICLVYEAKNRNFGDKIIGYSMDYLVRYFLGRCEIQHVPLTKGFETSNLFYNCKEIEKSASKSDLVIFGGGGILDIVCDHFITAIKKIDTPMIFYSLGWNVVWDIPFKNKKCLDL